MSYGCVIIDFSAYELNPEERELLKHPQVAGIILFTRNYHDQQQVTALIAEAKKIRPGLIVSVDHEGGRVQRFRPGFSVIPPMAHFGELYQKDPRLAEAELFKTTQLMVRELQAVGVNLNWAPVLDIAHGVSEIIGNRSFGANPEIVVHLAKIFIKACHELGMPVTGKHFPGHGGVAADSHLELPIDVRSLADIEAIDLKPFRELASSLDAIMPAHVVYSAVDPEPAGFSSYWLQSVLRQQLNFEGVIVSDDLTMAGAAMAGSYSDRAGLALQAGCDLLPVCNKREGAVEVLQSLENYQNTASQERLSIFIEKLA